LAPNAAKIIVVVSTLDAGALFGDATVAAGGAAMNVDCGVGGLGFAIGGDPVVDSCGGV